MATNRSYGAGRTESVVFRCTPEEKDRLTVAASSVGLNVSDYARSRTLGSTGNVLVDAAANSTYAATYTAATPPDVTAAVQQALEATLPQALLQARRAIGGEGEA